jgi:hypothetical protein
MLTKEESIECVGESGIEVGNFDWGQTLSKLSSWKDEDFVHVSFDGGEPLLESALAFVDIVWDNLGVLHPRNLTAFVC